MRWILFTVAAGLVAFGAAGAEVMSAAEIKEARKLHIAKCAKCHKLYDPAKYDDAEWSKWMTKMSKKAKLKPAQAELLARYLNTVRTAAGTNAVPKSGSKR